MHEQNEKVTHGLPREPGGLLDRAGLDMSFRAATCCGLTRIV